LSTDKSPKYYYSSGENATGVLTEENDEIAGRYVSGYQSNATGNCCFSSMCGKIVQASGGRYKEQIIGVLRRLSLRLAFFMAERTGS
jgi:hypothetical protein